MQSQTPNQNHNHDSNQTDRLISLAENQAELWHSPDSRTFATVMVGMAKRSFPIESRDFENWLRQMYFVRHNTAPGQNAVTDAVLQANAKALFLGDEHEVFIRVGQKNDKLYLDLADDCGRMVEISTRGWNVVVNPDVRFVRAPGMQPLPVPVPGGSVRELRSFLNVPDEDAFVLATSFLIAAIRPSGPYPISFLQGEQGSAKSTTGRVLRRLIDPASPLDKTKPKNEQDLFIDADNNWVLLFDNLSRIPDWLADAFCRIATGGGFSTRKLYRGRDQETFSASRPQILNGIDDLAVRDDLRDRGLLFVLPVIRDEHRVPESSFWGDFESAHPRILGALLDAVSTALRRVDSIHLHKKPRMADFAVWVTAAEEALPWEEGTFLAAYERNRREAVLNTLEHEPIVSRLLLLLDQEGDFIGTSTELLSRIRNCDGADWSLPKTASDLSRRLKRIVTALRGIGVEVTWSKDSNRNRTRITTVRRVRDVQTNDESE